MISRSILIVLTLHLGLAAQAESWLPPVSLSAKGRKASSPSVALNGKGQGLVVWSQLEQGRHWVYGAAWHRRPGKAGGVWGPPTRVDPGEGGGDPGRPKVVMSDAGTGMVIWSDPGGVWAVPWQEGGWGSPAHLPGPCRRPPQIAMDGAGNATALWTEQNDARIARFTQAGGWVEPTVTTSTAKYVTSALHPSGKGVLLRMDLADDPDIPPRNQQSLYFTQSYDPASPGGWSGTRFFEYGPDDGIINTDEVLAQGAHQYFFSYGMEWYNGDWELYLRASKGGSWEPEQGRQLVALNLALDGSDRAFLSWVIGGVPKVVRVADGKVEPVAVLGPDGTSGAGATTLALAVAPGGRALAVYGGPNGCWSQSYLPPGRKAAGWGKAVPVARADLQLALEDGGHALAAYVEGDVIRAMALEARPAGKEER